QAAGLPALNFTVLPLPVRSGHVESMVNEGGSSPPSSTDIFGEVSMKKLILAAAVSTFALAGAAFANVGAGLVGNTVTLTGPDGAVTKIYYPDESSIVVKGADGSES